MHENDEINQILLRLNSPSQPDNNIEFAWAVRRLIIERKIPPNHANLAISFAISSGHNYVIYTGNRWFDNEFKAGLEYYANLPDRLAGVPARAALLGIYYVTSLIPTVRDDLIASISPLEAVTPFDPLVDGADAGNISCQNALILAECSPMTEEFTRK